MIKKLILCSRYKLCFYSFSDDNLKSWDDFFFSMFAVFIRLGKDLQKAARGLVLEMSEAQKIVLVFLENSAHQ